MLTAVVLLVGAVALSPDRRWCCGSAGAVVLAVAASRDPVVAMLLLDAVGAGVLVIRARNGRRRRRLRVGLPEAADEMASALRAGRSMSEAAISCSRTAPGLAVPMTDLARALDLGAPLATAVDVHLRRGDSEVALLAASLELADRHRHLGPDTLRRAADTMRLRRLRREDLSAQVAHARASAAVIAVSPWIVLALAGLADPDHLDRLVTTSVGRWCVALSGGLSVLGAAAIAALIERSGLDR